VREVERKMSRKGSSSTRSDIAKDGETMFIPAELPGEDGGKYYNKKSIRDDGDSWKARLKSFFDRPA